MRIGLALPSNWGLQDPADLVDLSVLAEEMGFDTIWMGEHILNIGYIEQRIGDLPYYAPLALIAYIAARTSRIKLGTSVLVLPNYHPATLAKFIATLDQLSGGRIILGVGVGGNKPEFDALGIPFAERGEMSNEMLEVIRALFGQRRATHHGKRWNFDEVIFSPKPAQDPFPIWVGGMLDSAASLRRAALYGEGWQPAGLSHAEFQAGADRIRAMAREAGRDPSGFCMCMGISVDYGEPLSFEAERKAMVSSEDPVEMARYIKGWADHGADELMLRLNVPDIAKLKSEIVRIGEVVLPLVGGMDAA